MLMKKLALLLIAMFIIGAVGFLVFRNSSNSIENQIMAMQGRHVNLNFKDAGMKYNGVDSAFVSLEEPKMVVFVDSLSCSGCFLNHLAGYYEINDSLRNRDASMLVILHPIQEKIS